MYVVEEIFRQDITPGFRARKKATQVPDPYAAPADRRRFGAEPGRVTVM